MRKFLRTALWVVVLAGLPVGGFLAGALYQGRFTLVVGGGGAAGAATVPAAVSTVNPTRKILYWTDTMYNPPYISDKPGKSPMGMDLTPVYEDQASAGGEGGVKVDPVVVQNMGVRAAKATRGPLQSTLRNVGVFSEPEQNNLEINLRVSGWIQKLYANQEGMAVTAGDKLFDLFSPELTAAVDELIVARKQTEHAGDGGGGGADAALKESAVAVMAASRRKLLLAGLAEGQIDGLSKLDKSPATITFVSPRDGHVRDKSVVEGAAVKSGDKIMRIADRSTMWLLIQVYEQQLSLVKPGTEAQAEVTAIPGKTFKGKVDFIYPHLDMASRTATARLVFPNHDHELREGMYATVRINAQMAAQAVLVPREALLDSGDRQIVFLSEGQGHFSPRKVTVGRTGHRTSAGNEADEEVVEILTGLNGTETVVTSGQFLLDSESRRQEAIAKHLSERLLVTPPTPSPAAATSAPATTNAALDARVDTLVRVYLGLSLVYGRVEPEAGAAGVQELRRAAQAIEEDSGNPDKQALGKEIAEKAKALSEAPADKKRAAFKGLSAAVIGLVEKYPPSWGAGPAIWRFHCPMAQADWLAQTEQVENPFYASGGMKTCGELVGRISLANGKAGDAGDTK